MIKYRPEIDGLRALAVLPVVLFHLGFEKISGGYIGVDVFFVISGFLITSIIYREILAGEFSLAQFYKRRILRILPALIAVIITTLILSWVLLFPAQQKDVGRSAVWAMGFASNIFFWKTQDYFRANSIEDPLLHTWSLGVEEQFYVIFPIMMLIIAFFPRRPFRYLIGLACMISIAPLIFVDGSNSAKFYLMPTRFWEMGLGAMIAFGVPKLSLKIRTPLVAIALLTLMLSYIFINDHNGFPGLKLAIPVISTCILIAYLPDTPIASWLSVNIMTYIGKISYSMYLWHWPMITFYYIKMGTLPTGFSLLAYGGILFGLSALSKKWLEDPIRHGYRPKPAILINAFGIASIIMVIGIGLFAQSIAPSLKNIPENILNIQSYSKGYAQHDDYVYQWRRGTCFVMEKHERKDPNDSFGGYNLGTCLTLSEERPNVIIIGDSHAGNLWRALSEKLPHTNIMQVTSTGCHPLITDISGRTKCRNLINHIYSQFIRNNEIDGIILAARWRDEDIFNMSETLNHLKKDIPSILVFGPTPEFTSQVPITVAHRIMRGQKPDLLTQIDVSRRELDKKLEPVVRGHEAYFSSLHKTLCDEAHGCNALLENNIPTHFDLSHFTLQGARHAIDALLERDKDFISFVQTIQSN